MLDYKAQLKTELPLKLIQLNEKCEVHAKIHKEIHVRWAIEQPNEMKKKTVSFYKAMMHLFGI